MKIMRPVKLSGVALNLDNNSWTFVAKLQCGESWENIPPIGSPSILSDVLYTGELLRRVNLSSHAIFD